MDIHIESPSLPAHNKTMDDNLAANKSQQKEHFFSISLPQIMRRRSTNLTHRSSLRSSLHTNSNDMNSIGSDQDRCDGDFGEGCHPHHQKQPYQCGHCNSHQLPDVHVLRRDMGYTTSADGRQYTDSTMFSVISPSTDARSSSAAGSCRRSKGRRQSKLSSLRSFLKVIPGSSNTNYINGNGKQRPSAFRIRRSNRPLSEAQLRKQLKKLYERSDWGGARKLIASHEFSDIPEVSSKQDSTSGSVIHQQDSSSVTTFEPPPPNTTRRPSYGSRNGDRLSFTGKESAAAAAVIKAAMLEESSSVGCASLDQIDIGENVLHDICRYQPPWDVIELLLASLRHRRGSTVGKDSLGRTPLHVAAACGSTPKVIDALVRADPTPASMGDGEKCSPLHLVMRSLVYQVLPGVEVPGIPSHSLPHAKKKEGKLTKQLSKKGGLQSVVKSPSRDEVIETARKTVAILKNAMMTYPGKVNFKDEDTTGFAPLDYAIDGGITDEGIIQFLIRRTNLKETRRRSTMKSEASEDTHVTCNRSTRRINIRRFSTDSNVSCDSRILHQLEQDEMEARRDRIEKIKARRTLEDMNDALYDVFGIEEEGTRAVEGKQPVVNETLPTGSSPSTQTNAQEQNRRRFSREIDDDDHMKLSMLTHKGISKATLTVNLGLDDEDIHHEKEEEAASPTQARDMTEEDIYNHHLQAYLDDFHDEEDMGDLEYCEDDDFLLNDPDEVQGDEDEQDNCESVKDEPDGVPLFEICVVLERPTHERNHCGDSCVSEVTAPELPPKYQGFNYD